MLQLDSIVSEQTNQDKIKFAKARVLAAYLRQPGSIHQQKIQRVQNILCESIRRGDQILTSLLEKKAVTLEEYNFIKTETNVYRWSNLLLDVLSAGPVSSYECFLETLDATHQHELRRLLEEEGSVL